MKQCVKFPEEKFLAVRSCLVAICMGNRPAANLLSILLFRYNLRMENKDDAENQNAVKTAKGETPDQDTSVRIFRTQAQLVDDMCGEMTEKTLHDTAVPMLQLLGFLDLEEHMIANCYILHVDLVQQALNLYVPGKKEQVQLEKFLISTMQLEKFLITSDELEKFLIDKKNFLSGLEKVLIANRKISNQQRGRKLRADVPLRGKKRLPKNLEEESKKNLEEDTFASAHVSTAPSDFLPEETHEHDAQASRPAAAHDPLPGSSSDAHAFVGATADVEETAHRIPAIKIGAPNGQLNTLTASASIPGEPENSPLSVHSPHSLQGTDGAATGPEGSGPRASGKRKGKKVTQEPEPISQEALRILDEWDVLMKRRCPRTEGEKGTIAAAQALIPSHPSHDDLKAVWQFLFTSNPDWYRAHGVSIQDIEKNFGKWQSLQVKPDAPATNGKPDVPVIKRWSAAEARAYRKVLEAKQGDLQA